ncbi:MAG: BatA domain-containing protein [Planctomycetes bacterium]|nr:BatA domain-containing protein [Planctomycetota bacterium]
MLALAFLNPLLLWGIPLASVPIIIHLLNRRRFQRVPWAAMEFLLAAMKRNRKRLRMEQWLVLLLRTLAVLFLVFLVARPQLSGGGLIGTRTHHVVVLDDTVSMTQRSGSTNLFERAQDRTRALADKLAATRDGDLFSIVRASRPTQPDMWSQRVGADLGQRVGKLLKELEVGDAGMDLGKVLEEVRRRAAEVKEAGRTEYVLATDVRTIDWLTDDDKPRPGLLAQIAALKTETEHITVSQDDSNDADNLAVVAVRRADRVTVAGVPVTLAVDVQNFGLDNSEPAELAVEVDGKSRVVRPIPQLSPGERTTVAITHTFHTAGNHRVEAGLATAVDHFLVDDRRWLAIEVQERSRVLLVDGDPGDTSDDAGETFFLQVALEPGGEAISGVEVQIVLESALGETDLAPFDMVWLCNCPVPLPAVVQKVQKFVEDGGGLVFFAGAQVDPARYNDAFWQAGKGLLPMPFGEIEGDPDRPEHAFLATKDHPLCGKLGEVLELLLGRAVLLKRYLTMNEDPNVPASIVARARDAEGTPIVAARSFGSGGGQVVQFGITADKHWSNLPDTYAMVILANQAHRFAARARDLAPYNLGTRGTWRLQLDPGTYKPDVTVRATVEGGEERTFTAVESKPEVSPAAGVQAPPPQLVLDLAMADLRGLGAFEVDLLTHGGGVEKRMLARNLPTEESRLIRLTQSAFTKAWPAELQERVTFERGGAGSGRGTGEGEIWRLLAAALLLGLVAESFLAWRFGRR